LFLWVQIKQLYRLLSRLSPQLKDVVSG